MQLGLFDRAAAGFDLSRLARRDLGRGAWLEHAPHFLSGQQRLFDELRAGARWVSERRRMYERWVEVPRLVAPLPPGLPATSLIDDLGRALSRRYGRSLCRVSLACYRDGRDSVAMHGDKMGSLVPDTVIAILALGAARRFLLAPALGGRSTVYPLGEGDLLVMGGTCQQTFVHGVPKVNHAGPRISVQFRERVPDVASAGDRPLGLSRPPAPRVTAGRARP